MTAPTGDDPPAPAGHRLRSHTADTIVEAWAGSVGDCLAQAVHGLASSFADVAGATPTDDVEVVLEGSHEGRLMTLLDEVIYRLDVADLVPVDVNVADDASRALVRFAPLGEVAVVGDAPKAIAWSELSLAEGDDGSWRCRFIVDV